MRTRSWRLWERPEPVTGSRGKPDNRLKFIAKRVNGQAGCLTNPLADRSVTRHTRVSPARLGQSGIHSVTTTRSWYAPHAFWFGTGLVLRTLDQTDPRALIDPIEPFEIA